MKRLFFAFCLSAIISNVSAQGGPTQDPFPANDGVFPAQGYLNRQFHWVNSYMSFAWFGWSYTTPDFPEHENVAIQLFNYTDEELETTVSVREMGIERVVMVPPHSSNFYPIGRIEDYNTWDRLLMSGVHLFVRVNQPNYHFNLGVFYWRPGVWNAPGGGFPYHKKDLQY